MLKTTITPDNTNINLIIPSDYVGKQIEVLLYAVEELQENKSIQEPKKRKPSDYAGCISKETAETLLQHVEQSRNEWERNIL